MAGRPGLVLVGKAQERTSVVAGLRRRHPLRAIDPSHPHIAWRRQSSVPDHWYFYFSDPEWGPAFLKLCYLRALPAVVCLLWRKVHKRHYAPPSSYVALGVVLQFSAADDQRGRA